ncbi:larval cuticle protein 65Ab1-like [Stomoxys calcitrans]|uniref:larval cuticle protein 65Ab1-like n=1 Tax=Stomoxys calcitrans TaxID=35570 RepID=UPI0027E3202A|nr:larval cuticle protein 65Ab1-like [Stomoxys calcitrans]
MKFLIVLVALVALAVAAPTPDEHDEHADIVKLNSKVDHHNYAWDAETSNGIHQEEHGEVKDYGKDHAILVHGSYSWKDHHDGKTHTVTYYADDHGYHPKVEHN